MAQDATLHVKIDPATNEELARLAAARKTFSKCRSSPATRNFA